MATIEVTPTALYVRYTRREKIGGLLRDLAVPVDSIAEVGVETDGLAAATGFRAPGLAIPGRRKIGTWRARGQRTAVTVRRGEPAVLLRLEAHKYSDLLIGTPHAQQIADRLTEPTSGATPWPSQ